MDERLKKELENILCEVELKHKTFTELKREYIQKYARKYGLLGALLLWKQIESEALKGSNGR